MAHHQCPSTPQDPDPDPVRVPPLDVDVHALFVAPFDALAEKDDAEWFRAHPLRSHRVRPALGAELTVFGKPDDPAHVAAVTVRQATPGVFLRLAVWLWPQGLAADEGAAWAVFDHSLRLKRSETMSEDWLLQRVRQLRQAPEAVVM